MTAKSTWKKRESQVASFFGARRNRLSGSSGRDDESASDSTHEKFFIETKLRVSHYARELWDSCKEKCKGKDAGKVPVVVLASKNKPGFMVCVHSSDLEHFAKEYLSGTWSQGNDNEEYLGDGQFT